MAKMTIEDIQRAGVVKPITEAGDPDPILTIMPSEALTLGDHTFQLVVSDDAGRQSAAVTVTVTVIDTENPNAVVIVKDEDNATLDKNQVPRNTSFVLDASRSFDPDGGAITSYQWRLILRDT